MVANGWSAIVRGVFAVIAISPALAGCALEAEEAAEQSAEQGDDQRGIVFNGIVFNGIVFNGIVFNGVNLDGGAIDQTKLHVPVYAGAYEGSETLLGVQLSQHANSLIGWTHDSEFYEDNDFVGVEQKLTLNLGDADEESFVLQVAGIHETEWEGVRSLDLRYRPLSGGAWSSPCVDENDNPTRAILMHGRYGDDLERTHAFNDTHTMTIACEDSVIGKCLTAGYASWVDQSMADLHQTCVRMVYADYCGVGEPNTENGTAIDLEDLYGIQTFETDWPIEAAWSRDGALCLNAPRKLGTQLSCALPTCTEEHLGNATIVSKAIPSL